MYGEESKISGTRGDRLASEVEGAREFVQDLQVEVVVFAQQVADRLLAQARAETQEAGHLGRLRFLRQQLNALHHTRILLSNLESSILTPTVVLNIDRRPRNQS